MGYPKVQRWDHSQLISQLGVDLVLQLLEHLRTPNDWCETLEVRDMQNDKDCQTHGFDFVWGVKNETGLAIYPIEVKADTYHDTGNFFFETVSDIARGTTGCFLSSNAKFLMYSFPGTASVYCFPLPEVRKWFEPRLAEFREVKAHSWRNGRRWNTLGRLISINRLLREVPDVRRYWFNGESWRLLSS